MNLAFHLDTGPGRGSLMWSLLLWTVAFCAEVSKLKLVNEDRITVITKLNPAGPRKIYLDDFKVQVDALLSARERNVTQARLLYLNLNFTDYVTDALVRLMDVYPEILQDMVKFDGNLFIQSIFKAYLVKNRLHKYTHFHNQELVQAVNDLSDDDLHAVFNSHDLLVLAIVISGYCFGSRLQQYIDCYQVQDPRISIQARRFVILLAKEAFPGSHIRRIMQSSLTNSVAVIQVLFTVKDFDLEELMGCHSIPEKRILVKVARKEAITNAEMLEVCEYLWNADEYSLAQFIFHLRYFDLIADGSLPVKYWRIFSRHFPRQLTRDLVPSILDDIHQFLPAGSLPSAPRSLIETLLQIHCQSDVLSAIDNCAFYNQNVKTLLRDKIEELRPKPSLMSSH